MKQIACVLLAAGNGVRFGGDKLLTSVNGKTLIAHAVSLHAAQPYAVHIAVIRTGDAALRSELEGTHFVPAYNPAPEEGISGSVRIGLAAAIEVAQRNGIRLDGILFSVSDQPKLRAETVERMMELFSAHPNSIVAPASRDGRRGNPVIFPQSLFAELQSITGDRGGGAVIKAHPEQLLTCLADDAELFDVDTREDADTVETLLASNPID